MIDNSEHPSYKDNEWNSFQLPNIPLLRCKLSDDIVKYLWNCIDDAVKDNKSEFSKEFIRLALGPTLEFNQKGRATFILENVFYLSITYASCFLHEL